MIVPCVENGSRSSGRSEARSTCSAERQQQERDERRRMAIQRLLESAPQPREPFGSVPVLTADQQNGQNGQLFSVSRIAIQGGEPDTAHCGHLVPEMGQILDDTRYEYHVRVLLCFVSPRSRKPCSC
jgi:hypothetical protein